MPTSRAISLGGTLFLTKKDAASYIKFLLHSTETNQELTGTSLDIVKALLDRHPRAQDKIGTGVASIYVVQRNPSRCFFVRRTDGTEIDFSYQKCLAGSRET